MIDHLGHLGPAPVSALAAALGAPMPELSNHLRRLREAGLVRARRDGCQAVYELAGTGVELLLPLLDRLVAPAAPAPARAASRTRAGALLGRGWIERTGGRELRVTDAGRRRLRATSPPAR